MLSEICTYGHKAYVDTRKEEHETHVCIYDTHKYFAKPLCSSSTG